MQGWILCGNIPKPGPVVLILIAKTQLQGKLEMCSRWMTHHSMSTEYTCQSLCGQRQLDTPSEEEALLPLQQIGR